MRKWLMGGAGAASRAGDLGLLILRVAGGAALLTHGVGKLPPSAQFLAGVERLGFPAPLVFAWLAALAESLGSVLIAIGLLTRPAAFGIAFTMATAFFRVHAADPFARKELPFLFLTIAVAVLLVGPGRYSMDAVLRGGAGPTAKRRR